MLKENFTGVDMVIFASSLLVSVVVGGFYGLRSMQQRQNTATALLLGGRRMPIVPTALSVLTSFLSGVLLLAVPAEIYNHGALMWVYMVSGVISLILTGLVYLPVIYRLRPTSVYEYFEKRFRSPFLRRLASFLFLLNTLVFMSIVIYAPAVALNGVSTIPTWVFIVSVGLVCTIYTSLGGLRAVVWTDSVQAIFMLTGVLVLVIKGTTDSGGLGNVFQEVSVHGRLKPLTNIDPSPLQYFSVWIAFFGGMAFWLSQYGVNQMAMQRYCSLSSQNQACTVIAIVTPSYFLLVSLACSVGLVMFAFFNHCDPISAGTVHKQDQLVILMVGQSLGRFPGLPGLFLAALCSGTLSTLSSGINSLAAVTYEDFLKTFSQTRLSERGNGVLVKLLSLSYGLIATGLAFFCEPLGGLLKAATSVMGTLAGPLAGLFTLGVLVPRANKYGAIFGTLISEAFLVWICVGSYIYNPFGSYRLETFNDNCNNLTSSSHIYSNSSSSGLVYSGQRRVNSNYGDDRVFLLYRISNWLYPFLGILLVLIVGSFVSLCISDKESVQLSEKHPQLTIFDQCAVNGRDKRVETEESYL